VRSAVCPPRAQVCLGSGGRGRPPAIHRQGSTRTRAHRRCRSGVAVECLAGAFRRARGGCDDRGEVRGRRLGSGAPPPTQTPHACRVDRAQRAAPRRRRGIRQPAAAKAAIAAASARPPSPAPPPRHNSPAAASASACLVAFTAASMIGSISLVGTRSRVWRVHVDPVVGHPASGGMEGAYLSLDLIARFRPWPCGWAADLALLLAAALRSAEPARMILSAFDWSCCDFGRPRLGMLRHERPCWRCVTRQPAESS